MLLPSHRRVYERLVRLVPEEVCLAFAIAFSNLKHLVSSRIPICRGTQHGERLDRFSNDAESVMDSKLSAMPQRARTSGIVLFAFEITASALAGLDQSLRSVKDS
jgi:hypothetical protein